MRTSFIHTFDIQHMHIIKEIYRVINDEKTRQKDGLEVNQVMTTQDYMRLFSKLEDLAKLYELNRRMKSLRVKHRRT